MIEVASRGDAEVIAKIEEKCFDSPLSLDFIYQDIADNPYSRYLIEKHKSEVVGYISLWLSEPAQIINIAVVPSMRNKGIGKMLLIEGLKNIQAAGITSVTLEVARNNQQAIYLYEDLDFKVIGTRDKYYKNGEDALVMEKVI